MTSKACAPSILRHSSPSPASTRRNFCQYEEKKVELELEVELEVEVKVEKEMD